jgi:malonate transporter MadL subunit
MKIYGVAILGACFLVGQLFGELLGRLLGMDSNVGGVGFAMFLLMIFGHSLKMRGFMTEKPERGILFWSAMYIPVVVAMSATQNVKGALTGGWVAIFVGVIGTAVSFLCIPLIVKLGNKLNHK